MATPSAEPTRELLHRHARVAGLRHEPTPEAIHRRRAHLLAILSLLVFALVVATALVPLIPGGSTAIDPDILRFALIGVSGAFLAYAIEKERALRQLECAFDDEHRRREDLGRELEYLRQLVSAGQTMTATLDLEQVVDCALDGALSLFDAPAGAMFLDRGDVDLQTARGDPQHLDDIEKSARAAAKTRAPVLASPGDAEGLATMSVPMWYEERLMGVLVVVGTGFSQTDLETLDEFAAHAAAAIGHARSYQAEKTVTEQFSELREVRDEFAWLSDST